MNLRLEASSFKTCQGAAIIGMPDWSEADLNFCEGKKRDILLQGSILQNSISDENFSDKFSASNFEKYPQK
jgi:hypothetical protein